VQVQRDYIHMVCGTDITFELIAQVNCVIFLRTQDGAIAEPRDNINRFMCKNFELVTLNGNGLGLLEDMLVDIYMPLLAYFEHRMSYISLTEAVSKPSQSQSAASSKFSEDKVSTSTGQLHVFTQIPPSSRS